MSVAEAFADWGQDAARREDPKPVPQKRPTLKPVSEGVDPDAIVLVVRIEFTEEDIGA